MYLSWFGMIVLEEVVVVPLALERNPRVVGIHFVGHIVVHLSIRNWGGHAIPDCMYWRKDHPLVSFDSHSPRHWQIPTFYSQLVKGIDQIGVLEWSIHHRL